MKPPDWLTNPLARCYAIPEGAMAEGEIFGGSVRPIEGRVAISISESHEPDAWFEACTKPIPGDGLVWLVRQEWYNLESGGWDTEPPNPPCCTCHGVIWPPGITHKLIREDAEPIEWDWSEYPGPVEEGIVGMLAVFQRNAGLRFILPERECPCGARCNLCKGTGRLPAERYDVWRDDKDKGE